MNRGAGTGGAKGGQASLPFVRGEGQRSQRKVPSMTKSDLIVTNIAISVNKVPSQSTKVPSMTKSAPLVTNNIAISVNKSALLVNKSTLSV